MTTAAARDAMPWGEHLREARRRALRAAAALVLGAVAGYFLSDYIMEILRAPIAELAESRNASLNYDSVTGAFNLRMKISVFAGIVLSSPVWLFELFGFLTPGLTRRERRYTFGFLAAALPLFLVGGLTGLRLFPHMVEVLAGFGSAEDSTMLQATYYFDFVMRIVLAIGVAFVVPVVIVMLNLLGVLPGRTILKGWRAAVMVIVLFSALATPAADVLSMFLVAVPMTALFLTAVAIALIHDRYAAQGERKLSEADRTETPAAASL